MEELIEHYRELKTTRAVKIKERTRKRKQLKKLRRQIKSHDKARLILTEAGKVAQLQMKRRIETLVTLAIRTVFDRPLTFKLVFEEKRKHVEARPVILEGSNEYVPKDDLGGGMLDIISFALRLVLWHISSPRSRNVFILDEPFKFTGKLIVKAGEMVKYLSKQLGFQVVLVSHDDGLIAICDRVYMIHHNGTESVVQLIKDDKPIKIKRRKK